MKQNGLKRMEIKKVHCKGRHKTGEKCETFLFESDGASIFIRLETGNDSVIELKNNLDIICSSCGSPRRMFAAEKKYKR